MRTKNPYILRAPASPWAHDSVFLQKPQGENHLKGKIDESKIMDQVLILKKKKKKKKKQPSNHLKSQMRMFESSDNYETNCSCANIPAQSILISKLCDGEKLACFADN